MKKTRSVAAILLSMTLATSQALPAAAQAASQATATPSAAVEESGAADVVVLLDVSQSVLPYFQDVTDFVLSAVVKDFLRFGDTFHLLTFGDSAQAEIAQRMTDERDVKSVLGRLYLLYPLARYSDFLGALGHLRQYLSDLPVNRRKVVVVITDGVQNPPPGSPNASMDAARVASEIESTCAGIRSNGWDLHLIRLPFAPQGATASGGVSGAAGGVAAGSAKAATGMPSAKPAEAGGTSYFDLAASALGGSVSDFSEDGKESLARKTLALTSVTFPDHLGRRGYTFAFPLRVENGADVEVGLELEALMLGAENVLTRKSFLTLPPGKSGTMDLRVALPSSIEPGERSLDVELRFANGIRVSPQAGSVALTLVRIPFASFFRSGARVALFLLLLLLCLALAITIVVLLRRVPRKAEAPIVAAVLDSAAESAKSRTTASGAGAKAAAARPAAAIAAADEHEASIARDAAALAEASKKESAETANILAQAAARRSPASAAPPAAEIAATDEHEASIARAATEMAKASKEESAQAADVLAQAAARRSPASALADFLASRGRGSAAKRKTQAASAASAEATSGRAAAKADVGSEGRVVRPGTIRVELRVEGQNPNVGMRNVCTLHAGQSKTVGGGRSDFLVFLVPTAKRAAELRFDGQSLSFVPRRPELFPGTEGIIEDCIDTDILMLGRGDYPLVIRFVLYERPLDKINKLLRCIETPGLAEGLDFESY